MTNQERIDAFYTKLEGKDGLISTACCIPGEGIPKHVTQIHKSLPKQITEQIMYGCGTPIPLALSGLRVLDLGCGAGKDVFTLAKLVGEHGFVIGWDMNDKHLSLAREVKPQVVKAFGYDNTSFEKGDIQDLSVIPDNSIDVIVSNCVINLADDKPKVFAESKRILKEGGEMYFSDVYADRILPKHLKDDDILLGECISGAIYVNGFHDILSDLGIYDVRQMSESPIEVLDEEKREKLGKAKFTSRTMRIFNLELDRRCEDYGQAIQYMGNIPHAPHSFVLDDHHEFETGKVYEVCRNTARMLSQTRFKPFFRHFGDESTHYGVFDCAKPLKTSDASNNNCC